MRGPLTQILRANQRTDRPARSSAVLPSVLFAALAALAPDAWSLSCATTKIVKSGGGGDYTTIQAAVNGVPGTAFTGDYCIDIQDSATYNEAVSINGKNPNGFQLAIGAITTANNPVVNPPASSLAAFYVINASVTLENIAVRPTNAISYGVWGSSPNVTISTVIVDDPGGRIGGYGGITVSSYCIVAYSSSTAGSAQGIYVYGAGTSISFSSAASTFNALYLNGATSATVVSFFGRGASSGQGARLLRSSFNMIVNSTFTTATGAYGLGFAFSSNNSVASSYIQGSTGVFVSGSTNTALGGSMIVATSAQGSGVWLAGGSVGLSMSSDSIAGGAQEAGVYLDSYNDGLIVLSTNNFSTGAQYAIYVATQNSTASVFITSNTIVPTISASRNTYGIYVVGSAATIENNGIYCRTNGSMGLFTTRGVYATDASQLVLDHNRVSMPGLLTGGSFEAMTFVNSGNATIQYNDLHSTGTLFANSYLLRLEDGSAAATVRNNIFSASMTVTGSSATVDVSADSEVGFASNYNDWFSSNSLDTGNFGGVSYEFTNKNWKNASGQDGKSLAGNPLWQVTGPEDFHPRSFKGRWDPTAAAFVVDGGIVISPTIDAADPADPYAQEQGPNGNRANQGSYGDTVEASKSHGTMPSFCNAGYTVKQDGTEMYTSIQSAFNAIPANLTGTTCVVVEDTQTYHEQVTIQGFTNNNFVISLVANPTFVSSGPVVSPPAASTAGIQIINAAAAVFNVSVVGANPIPYGVYASSSQVFLSTVNVDSGGNILTAGIFVSTSATLQFSSVTVQSGNAIIAVGQKISVSYSTAVTASASGYGLYLDGVTTATLTSVYGGNSLGGALMAYSGWDTTIGSSFFMGAPAVQISGSTGTSVANSTLRGTSASGNGLWMTRGSSGLTLSANFLAGGASAAGVRLDAGDQGAIILSTNTFGTGSEYGVYAATAAAGTALYITSNTFLPTLPATSNTYGLYFNGLTSGATIENNSVAYRSAGSVAGFSTYGLYAQSSAGLMIDHNRISQPGLVTGGSFEAASFAGTTGSTFKFNDVLSTGTAFANAYLLHLTNASTGIVVKDNILAASMTVTGSSASISVSADSQGGFSSDYNDWFSSNSLNTGVWGGASYQLLGAWNAATGKDANSVAANPLWQVTSAEDFHPKSANGRYDPTSGLFVGDGATSPTIDRADPAEPFALEPAPNGGRANLGSYGDTAQASLSVGILAPGCSAGFNVKSDGSMDFSTISGAVAALSPTLLGEDCVVIRDTQTYNEQVTIQGFSNNGYQIVIMADPSFASSAPVVSPPFGSTAAFQVANASVTLLHVSVVSLNPTPYGVLATSANVTISSLSVVDTPAVGIGVTGNITQAAVSLSSWSTVSYSSMNALGGDGLYLYGAGDVVSYSTATAGVSGFYGLDLNDVHDNAFNVVFASNAVGTAVAAAGTRVAFTQSVFLSSSATGIGLLIIGTSVTVDGSSLINYPGRALRITSGSDHNAIRQSSLTGGAQLLGASQYNSLGGVTISAQGIGLELNQASSNTISNCTISGSTAVWVRGSTGTVVGASTLTATLAKGSGLALSAGSSSLTLSSSVVTGGASGYGINIEPNNQGLIVLSTNVIAAGAVFGIAAGTQTAGTQLYITSNTVLPTLGAAVGTYGLYFNGLTSGATIENNGIYYRASGSMASLTTYGLYAQSAAGLVVDHNRIDMPGALTAGSYEAASFYGTNALSFKFNDVTSTGTAFTSAYLMRLFNASTGAVVKDNIFLASMTVTASSASIIVSADSQVGLAEDYNDWFSSNSLDTGIWGASSYQLLAPWRTATSQDANSIAANPLWFSPGAGVEDFHPESVNGRWNPATQSFAADGVTSPTVDAADPAELYGLEPNPNGFRANQGSTGDTTEASRSAVTLPPGCNSGFNVKQDGTMDFTTIQAAVNALGKSLAANECVVVRDTLTYPEQVTVQGFTNNGFQVMIMADPGFVGAATPALNPPAASTAAFQVMNSSVTLYHFRVIPTASVQYGVSASSSYVTISSFSVDSGGRIWGAGVAISSWTSVAQSSITVQAAYGLFVSGSTNTISQSTMSAASASFYGLYIAGSSGDAIAQSYVLNTTGDGAHLQAVIGSSISQSTVTTIAGSIALSLGGSSQNSVAQCYIGGNSAFDGLYLGANSNYNTISQSTMTDSTLGGGALYINSSSSNTVTQSVMINPPGYAAVIVNSGNYNTISQSAMTSANASDQALEINNASYNTALLDVVTNTAGTALQISVSAVGNAVELSTVTGNGASRYGLYASISSSNTIISNYIQGPTAAYLSSSGGTVLGGNVIAATGTTGHGLLVDGGSVNLFASSNVFVGGANGAGIYIDQNNKGSLYLSTNVVLAGAQYGIYAATQAAAQIFITSNTILPAVGTGVNTYGIFLNGLTSGATIENNGILYRNPGSMAAFTTYGLYAQSSSGLMFDHNRISEPGQLTGGSFSAAAFVGTTGSAFKFNDVLATGASLTNAYLLQLSNASTGIVVKDNILEASMTVTGSSASISVSADSEGSFSSDYNDWFSSNSFNAGVWGGTSYQLLAAWRTATSQDANSVAANPLWQVTGVEDLHPRSMRGRYDPTSASFKTDAATSQTIDGADPGETSAPEPAPNGGRANQGSYGGTALASESAPPPASPAATVGSSSVTISWGAAADDGYKADAATAADFSSGVISSTTANSAATQLAPQGLVPNTTYYLRAGALYGPYYNYAAAVPASTVTLAAPPAAPFGSVFTAVGLSGFTLNWSSGTAATGYDPAGTVYIAEISTMSSFNPVAASSQTLNVSATFSGLGQDTAYFAQVEAINVSGGSTTMTNFGSTATLALGPGAASPAFTAMSPGALTINWTSNGNGAGTTYYAQISTMASFNPILMSSQTYNLFATFSSLNANTTYFLQAAAYSVGAATWTAFTNLGATSTLAGTPGLLSILANPASIDLAWSSGGPLGTAYFAQISTDNFLSLNASSRTLNASATFFGLVSNDTYYLQVLAINNNGVPTAFASLSTWTPAASPAAAAPSGIGLSSVTVNWLPNGDSTTTIFLAQISTDNFATVSASSQTLNLSVLFGAGGFGPSLAPNTSYYAEAKAIANGGLSTSYTVLPTTMTFAADPAPAVATFTAVTGISLTLNWSSGTLATGYNPMTTLYLAEISTKASFIPLWASSQTDNVSATFSGLSPNTAYFAQVQAINGYGFSGAFVNFGSTGTPTAAPGLAAPEFTAITNSGLTVNWIGNGNPTGTTYYAQISTMASFNPILMSSQTYNLYAAFPGLNVNTTYYAQAAAYDINTTTWTPFTNLTATSTLSNAPVSAVLGGIYSSSISINWGTNGDPAWTSYLAQVSIDNFATVSFTSRTLNASATFFALAGNATYYFQVLALNSDGAATSAASTPSTWTAVASPVSALPTGVTSTQLTANWTAADAAGTNYAVQLSTDNFATLDASSQTFNTSASFSGLVSNDTYYLQVQAIANNGRATAFTSLPSTWTAIAPPAALSPTTVGLSSMTANWGANGNVLGTIYVEQISTDGFATVNASSQTLNSAVAYAGLAPNTSYYSRVQVLGYGGQATAFVSLPSTMTLAADPGPAVATFTAVSGSGLTLNWSSGTLATGYDPVGTIYVAQISTMASFNPLWSSSQTLNTSVAYAGLTPNLPYFARVQAITGYGLATAFVSFGSTMTPTAQPGPASPVFTAVSASALTANWTANGDGAGTIWYAQVSTMASFNPILMSSQTSNLFATFPGLSANTTHFAQAAAFNLATSTWTAFTNLGSTSTLANAPLSPALAGVYSSSVSIAWGSNGDPGWTLFNAQISTDNFTTVNLTSRTLNSSATFFALASNATFYLRVDAVNNNGVPTAFAAAPATWTIAGPPVSAPPTGITTSQMTANWSSPDASGTNYVIQLSTDNFATLNLSSQTFNTSVVFSGLSANGTYYFRVDAIGNNGQATSYTALPTTWTLINPPTSSPPTTVGLSSMTANWGANGNAAGTEFIAQISTDNFSTVNASSLTVNNYAFFPGLIPNTSYYTQVQDIGNGGTGSPFTSLPSTMTLAADPAPAIATFTAVGGNTLTLSWSSGTLATGYDPSGTIFIAQISTMASFAPLWSSSQTFNTSVVFGGLTPNLPYFAEVRAINGRGVSNAFVNFGSTTTPTAGPGAGSPVFTAIANAGVTINWTSNGNAPGTTYYAQISTMASFNPILLSSQTYNLFAAFSGLGINTTYYAQAAAYSLNTSTWTAFTNLGATSTLANAPLSAALAGVYFSSIAFSWAANGDPGWTSWYAQISTDNFATVNFTSRTLNASATFFALASNATYFLQVAAVNNNGVPTALAGAPSTWTLTAPPLSANPTGIGAAGITANWLADGNAATTIYVAQISTDNFVTFNASSSTLNASAAYSGLNANTTYYFRVQAIANGGLTTPFVALPSTMTLLLAPGSAASSFAAVGTSSVTLDWTSGGNGPGTTFVAQISTDNFATISASSSTFNLSALFGTGGLAPALSPGTTYYGRVQAVNLPASSAFLSLGSTMTLAADPAPAIATFTAVGGNTLTLNWSSGTAATGYDGPGTLYFAQVSTMASFNPLAGSSQTYNLFSTFGGLAPNSVFFARAQAINAAGFATAFVGFGSTATPTAAPGAAAAAFTAISAAGLTVNWTSGGNQAGTTYYAQISTMPSFNPILMSSMTYNVFASFSGLGVNTTYYAQAAAYSLNAATWTAFTNLGATSTLANAPLSPALAQVNCSSISISWGANGDPGWTEYLAQISIDGFATVSASSQTLNANAAFAGLVSNATYYTRVAAISNSGAATAFVAAPTTWTLVSAPISAAPSGVNTTQATANWTTVDGTGTRYAAQISTDGFATVNSSSQTFNTFAVFSGLSPNTTYYFRAEAIGNNGQPTAFTTLPSTMTSLGGPGAAGTTFTAIGASSMTVNWTSGGDGPGTIFIAQISTDNFATVNASSSTLNLSAIFGTGGLGPPLSPNATFYAQVQSDYGAMQSPFTALGFGWTLANPPTGTAASNIQITSGTVSWSLNGNPAATLAEVQRSTDGASFALAFSGASTSLNDSTLQQCTTYFYRVRDRNIAGVATSFDATVSFVTQGSTPSAASALTAASVAGGKIALSWNPSPSPGVVSYFLYYDAGTGAINYGAPLAIIAAPTTSYTTGVLASSASYRFALRAENSCGITETNTSLLATAASTGTLSAVSAAVQSPVSGLRVTGDRVTLLAHLTAGTDAMTSQVLFEYKATTETVWHIVPAAEALHPNPAAAPPFFIHWNLSALNATNYDLRTIAYDLSGATDTALGSITIVADPVNWDIKETSLGGGMVQHQQVISNAVANTVSAADGASSLVTGVVIPAGALSTSSTTITIIPNPVAPGPPPTGVAAPNLAVSIALASGQTLMSGGQLASMSFTYLDPNGNGTVGTTNMAAGNMRVFSYNAGSGAWQQDIGTSVDTRNLLVTGLTPHFSFFSVFGVNTAANLGGVRVYPNPFKPNGSNPDEGRPYNPGDRNSGIVIDNLPADYRISIYTVSGSLVARFNSFGSGSGKVQWDARNDLGKDVSSGIYFLVIESGGTMRFTKKIAIIR